MHVRIFVALSSALERPDACVPLVVAAQAIPSSSDAERWIAAREVGLSVDYLKDETCLRSFYLTDEWPQEV
jgi:hypothetical protein